MTREEILQFEAGPELDRLVAEQVMRWRLDEDWREWFDAQGHSQGWQEDFRPSTDIAAAWEVVIKLVSKYSFNLASYMDVLDTTRIQWLADFGSATKIYRALASTAPLAICRAALLVVMEVDNE